jgi:hypothetical protein
MSEPGRDFSRRCGSFSFQHPALLLGFSARDPNFVRWMGWIRDVLGPHHHRAIALTTAEEPGLARSSMWASQIQFVTVPKSHLAAVLEKIAEYLRPASSASAYSRASDGLQRVNTVAEVVDEYERALDLLGEGYYGFPPDHLVEKLADDSALRVLRLVHGEGRAGEVASEICKRPREDVLSFRRAYPHLDPDRHPQLVRQRGLLRGAFGDHWWQWLAATAERQGLGISLRLGTQQIHRLDISAEVTHGPDQGVDVARLRLVEAEAAMLTSSDDPFTPVVEALDGKAGVYAERIRLRLDELRARHAFLTGGVPSDPVTHLDAQSARRQAFLLALDGDLPGVAEAYVDAARKSRVQHEPELVELWTIESALQALHNRGWFGDRIPSDVPDDLRTRANELRAQALREHADLPGHFYEHDPMRQKLLRARVDQLAVLRAAEARWQSDEPGAGRPGDGRNAMWVLDACVKYWVTPGRAASAAELMGDALWRNGHRADAAEVMARHGSRGLPELVRLAISNEWTAPVGPDVVDGLLREGRWTTEWLSRLEAVAPLVPEMRVEQLHALGLWLEKCASAILRDGLILSRGDGLLGEPGASRELAAAITARWCYSEPTACVAEWKYWSDVADRARSASRLGIELASHAARLPWAVWVGQARLLPEAAGDFLAGVLREQATSTHGWQSWRVYAAVLDLVEPKRSAPAAVALTPDLRAVLTRCLGDELVVRPEELEARTRLELALAVNSAERTQAAARGAVRACGLIENQPDDDLKDALGCLARLVPHSGLDDLVKWIDRVSSFVADWTSSSNGPARWANERNVGAAMRFAVAAISRDGLSIASLSTVQHMLVRLLEAAPAAAWMVAELPTDLTGDLSECLERTVGSMWTMSALDAFGLPRNDLGSAIGAAHAWAQSRPSRRLPPDWFDGLCRASAQDRGDAPELALYALAAAYTGDALPDPVEETMRRWSSTTRLAANSSRAGVVAAAAYAIAVGLRHRPSPPEGIRMELESVLATLRTDGRVAVESALSLAELYLAPSDRPAVDPDPAARP